MGTAINNGGDINLNANSVIALNDSDILAFARDGRGGNITVNTPVFLGFLYRPTPPGSDLNTLNGNCRVDINATGAISNGTITLPNTDPSRGLVALPGNLRDVSNLVDQSCSPSSSGKQTSQFVSTGRGGLPASPGTPLNPDATIIQLANISPKSPTRSTQANLPLPENKPPSIVAEAQGWTRLPNGRIKLVAQASNFTPHGNRLTTPGCYAR